MPRLLLTERAKGDLAALPRPVQEAVIETLTLLEADPESMGYQLRGRLRGLWSCRVGNYRILYTVEGVRARSRVIVRAIRHRGVVYTRRRRHRS
ncbi:MAG: type II toxin-antitoxin system RelE/ParE family toxin [Actinobacteria bacterium]|nr:type II toxin-antitoxin system RelE/ParE family toxin [Actinomycetota bacterium]